jgi:Spondin_N
MKLFTLAGLIFILLLGCSEDENIVTQPEPETNARYKLTFNATWSATTHPTEFPASAHFSGLIGMTHNKSATLFAKGETASNGIKNMAEIGSKNPLEAEIQTFISNGTGNSLISGGGVNPSPGEVSLEFDIASTHSLVSVVSMLAPSPDWFIAVSNINLIENNEWVTSKTITVDIYDAGTDDGSTFLSPNFPTLPPLPIAIITTTPLAVNNVVAPLGSITFAKID